MIDTNAIYNEDCLIGMEKLVDKSVDLILTDLPYGVTAAKWDNSEGNPAGSAPKFCPNCGTPTNGAKFCSNCGTKLI